MLITLCNIDQIDEVYMNNLKQIRDTISASQEDVAKELGFTQSAISHYETMRRNPDLEICRKLVSVLNKLGANCTLDQVFPPN